MLDKNVFIGGLEYIKNNYLNWAFDLSNMKMIENWYSKFANLDNVTFKSLLEEFTTKSIYAPNNPAEILKYLKEYDDVETAWNKILNVLNRSINNSMFQNIMAKEERFLYRFVYNWNIDKVGLDSEKNKCWGYCFGRHFKREYKQFLDSQKVKVISNQLECKEENLMIETSGDSNE